MSYDNNYYFTYDNNNDINPVQFYKLLEPDEIYPQTGSYYKGEIFATFLSNRICLKNNPTPVTNAEKETIFTN